MKAVFHSVGAMLDPAVVSDLVGRKVETVERVPMETKGWSSTGAAFEGVRLDGEVRPSLVLKTVDRATDWVASVTRDVVDREVATWESGLLDLLPSGVGHAVVAAVRVPGGSNLLMRNLTEEFLHADEVPSRAWLTGVLGSLAAMHAAYWQHPVLDEPGPARCRLDDVLGHLAPTRLPVLRQAVPDHVIVEVIDAGWAGLADQVGVGLADELRSLAVDPSPVGRLLSTCPRTLLHGDVRPANVALDGNRATLVDWARPCAGPPGMDVAYLMLMSPPSSPLAPDEAYAAYRTMLVAAVGDGQSWSWWDDHLDVCVAAVVAMMAPILVDRQVRDVVVKDPAHVGIAWWAERAEPGLAALRRA